MEVLTLSTKSIYSFQIYGVFSHGYVVDCCSSFLAKYVRWNSLTKLRVHVQHGELRIFWIATSHDASIRRHEE